MSNYKLHVLINHYPYMLTYETDKYTNLNDLYHIYDGHLCDCVDYELATFAGIYEYRDVNEQYSSCGDAIAFAVYDKDIDSWVNYDANKPGDYEKILHSKYSAYLCL